MQSTIWKYPPRLTDRQVIAMPRGSRILTVQEQAGTPTLWVWVDPTAPTEPHAIAIHGTGMVRQIDGEYIGTVQINGLVWHVFHAPY